MNKKAKDDGLILRWAAVYGASEYQSRFNAQTSGWCRPTHVTLNGKNRYFSMFAHNEIGPWVARHNMTSDDYQNEFNSWTPFACRAAASDRLPVTRRCS